MKPENQLYHIKVTRAKLESLRNLKLTEKDLDQLINITSDLSHQLQERDRLIDGMCALEKMLDRKKNFKLVKFNHALYGRKFIGVNASHIKKNGFKSVTKVLSGKAKKFANCIREKIVEQNLKVEHNIYYDMELVFFKDGRSKCKDDVIISLIREENGIGCSLIWVGLISNEFHIIY